MDDVIGLRMAKFTAAELDAYLKVGDENDQTRVVHRSMFTDPMLFEMEMKYIFESSWVYLAHETQVRTPGEYLTTWIGRVPVILYRDSAANLKGFVNTCTHRGATVCRQSRGRAKRFVCPFHGWAYDEDGCLIAPMHEESGAYPPGFKKEALGLRKVRVGSYKGFIFGTVNPEAPVLKDHLAEAKRFIDIIVDQSEQGIEVLPGEATYTFSGNWKMQAENGVDGYHVDAVHANYLQTVKHRHAGPSNESSAKDGADGTKSGDGGTKTRAMDPTGLSKEGSGYYDLGNGHTLLWADWPNPEVRPIYHEYDHLKEKMGEAAAKWAVGRLRNLLIYPNVFLMDQMSTQIRVFRPISVNETEVKIYCFAPVGESRDSRYSRLRQYEDFFNASGMATPDDLDQFNECQKTYHGASNLVCYNELSRGVMHEIEGADRLANELGIEPTSSGAHGTDEGIFLAQHARWLELMRAGISCT